MRARLCYNPGAQGCLECGRYAKGSDRKSSTTCQVRCRFIDKLSERLNISIHRTLTSIQMFAETGAFRIFLTSMLRSSVDAERIEEYREKLRQSMRVFWC